jgi:hypothetical protein
MLRRRLCQDAPRSRREDEAAQDAAWGTPLCGVRREPSARQGTGEGVV